MYRESLLGTALAITLEELAANLNEGQRERIWQVFDRTMNECLLEAPLMTRVQVRIRPPTSLSETQSIKEGKLCLPSKKRTLVSFNSSTFSETLLDPLATDSRGKNNHNNHVTSTNGGEPNNKFIDSEKTTERPLYTVEELSSFLNDPQLAFPVYRCVDGIWTIILKDPEVTVRDEFGEEETLKLDYLKVYLQQLPSKSTGNCAKSSIYNRNVKYAGGLQSWNPERKRRSFKRDRE